MAFILLNTFQKLFDAGEGKVGTDEEAFNMVMARRGFHQLRQIFHAYDRNLSPENGIVKAIKSEFSGSIKEAYVATGQSATSIRILHFFLKSKPLLRTLNK